MTVRNYRSSDCEPIARLFYDTVHSVNRKDYTAKQLNAWATGRIDFIAWDKSFLEHDSLVAETNGLIIGFGDIDHTGYLDRLYVHRDYQNRGIATAILKKLEAYAEGKKITTHASITARPFFENRGFVVIKEQYVERNGVLLKNFVMEKRM